MKDGTDETRSTDRGQMMRKYLNLRRSENNHKPCTTVSEMAEYFSITSRQMAGKIAKSKDRPIPFFDNSKIKNSSRRNYYNKKEFIDWYKRNYLNDEIEKT